MPMINTERFLKHLQSCRECKRKDRIAMRYLREVMACYLTTEGLDELPKKDEDD